MALSDISFIEQQAYGFLDHFGATLDHLQKQYEATGNEEFLKCRNRMIARYQQSKFFGDPASENNGEYDGGKTLVGPHLGTQVLNSLARSFSSLISAHTYFI